LPPTFSAAARSCAGHDSSEAPPSIPGIERDASNECSSGCREFRALGPVTVVTCSLHEKPFEGLRRRAAGASLLYLPPYSPNSTPSRMPSPSSKPSCARPLSEPSTAFGMIRSRGIRIAGRPVCPSDRPGDRILRGPNHLGPPIWNRPAGAGPLCVAAIDPGAWRHVPSTWNMR
jgi:hypothetical protein